MSRSHSGGKPIGWEYWGRRKGGFWVDRKTSHKMERMQLKEINKFEIDVGVKELYSEDEVIYTDPYMKSLYPNANKISSYYHYVCGYDVLVVDGKFAGELNDALELLAYAYHTGENYTDRDDLEMKYYEHLDYGNERWGFLP